MAEYDRVDDYRSLDAYLDGTMASTDQQQLEARIAADAVFAREVAAARGTERQARAALQGHLGHQVISNQAAGRIREAMHATMSGQSPPHSDRPAAHRQLKIGYALATVILLASFGVLAVSLLANSQPNQLAGPNTLLTADFRYSQQAPDGLIVQFSYSGIGADTFRWEFGDGNSSTEANPAHRYPRVDTLYQVTLRASNSKLGQAAPPIVKPITLRPPAPL